MSELYPNTNRRYGDWYPRNQCFLGKAPLEFLAGNQVEDYELDDL